MPKTLRIEVVVPVEVVVPADDELPAGVLPLTAANVSEALRDLVTDWHDGRHAFSAEMLHDGAGRIAGNAAHRALAARLEGAYGSTVVADPDRPGMVTLRSQVAQRYVEAAVPTAGGVRVLVHSCTARPSPDCPACGGTGEGGADPAPWNPDVMLSRSCSACRGTGVAS